jgi:hypothetical protein
MAICAQENVLALSDGKWFVNTPGIRDMEKMACCLLKIKEENESVAFVAAEQRFW